MKFSAGSWTFPLLFVGVLVVLPLNAGAQTVPSTTISSTDRILANLHLLLASLAQEIEKIGSVSGSSSNAQTAAAAASLTGAGDGACGTLATNVSLTPGQSIASCNGAYTLVFQGDGNVVLYLTSKLGQIGAPWNTQTNGKTATNFSMQGDGNLVLYNGNNALWGSRSQPGGTYGRAGHLIVGDNGVLTVFANDDGSVLWSSTPGSVAQFSPAPVTITPTVPAPTATLTQSVSSTTQGQQFDISWNSTNADSCVVQNQGPYGSITNPWATGTSGAGHGRPAVVGTVHYWIDCTGPGGTAHADIYHTVTAAAPTIQLTGTFSGLLSGASTPTLYGSAMKVGSDETTYVDVYIDGPATATDNYVHFVARTPANVNGHGFQWTIPTQFQGGTHTFYLYGVTADGYNGTPLTGSPQTIAVGSVQNTVTTPIVQIPSSHVPSFPTNRTEFVTDLYSCILNRQPDSGGLSAWVSTAPSFSLPVVYNAWFNSPEYINRAVPDDQYVTQLYNCILFRQPDQSGYSMHLGELGHNGNSRTDEVNIFTASSEFVTNQGARLSAVTGIGLNAPITNVTQTTPVTNSTPSNCIASGDQTTIQNALNGTGAKAILCPNAVFTVRSPIRFTADNQEISTLGYPTDGTRATIRVIGGNGQAIIGYNSGISLRSLIVDGGRPALGYLAGDNALIDIGGAASNQTVDHIKAYDPQGWSILHIREGDVSGGHQCTNATITNSDFGPAGHPSPYGAWSDGISLACMNSHVANNTITDTSDGGIVIFGAPGSLVENNLIQTSASYNQVLIGAINLEDVPPYMEDNGTHCDHTANYTTGNLGNCNGMYSGVVVRNNTINAIGGFIKVGIGIGPAVAGINTISYADGGDNHAYVLNNTIKGTHIGYGLAIDKAENFIVQGNQISGTYSGNISACPKGTTGPTAYAVNFGTPSFANNSFQSGFLLGTFHDVAGCVTSPF